MPVGSLTNEANQRSMRSLVANGRNAERNRCFELNVSQPASYSQVYTLQMSLLLSYQSKKFHRHANMLAARVPHQKSAQRSDRSLARQQLARPAERSIADPYVLARPTTTTSSLILDRAISENSRAGFPDRHTPIGILARRARPTKSGSFHERRGLGAFERRR